MLLSVLYYSQVCRFSHQQRRPHYSGGEWHQGFAENKQEENRLQSPVFGGKKYKTMIYSFPQLVLRYFTCAHIIPPPYSRDSSFQRRSISKLDTGVGPVPQDEGKPILSGIWETVTTVTNEDTGYGYWNGVHMVGGGSKEPETTRTPQTGSGTYRLNMSPYFILL